MDLVIFACVHSAGRSQMAAAFFNAHADPSLARAVAAGTEPAARVHPVVVEAMREVGIDVADARPRLLTEESARRASLLITMGCGERCPLVAGLEVQDWELPDPKDKTLDEVRVIRDQVRARVGALLAAHRWRA